MRKWIRRLAWTLTTVVGLPLVALLLVVVALNTRHGRQAFERVIPRLTEDQVMVVGLSGRFPDALHAARIEVRDGLGAWLVMRDLDLAWSPLRLLRREALIDHLEAGQISFDRLPAYPPDAEETDWALPLEINLQRFRVEQFVLAPEILGTSATLAVSGTGRFSSLEHAHVRLDISRHDQQGLYRGEARLDRSGLDIELAIEEAPQGLLAAWSGMSELGRLSLHGRLQGPRTSAQLSLQLATGQLNAKIRGGVNLEQETLDLNLAASAPSMRLRPDLSWQAATIDAEIRGAYAQPKATGTLKVDGLQAQEAFIRRIAAEITGDATGDVRIQGNLEGLRLPGPQPALFAAAPVSFEINSRLEQPERPLTFSLRHPLLRARGRLTTAGPLRGDVALQAPHLGAFVALAGLEAQGDGELSLQVAANGNATRLVSKGRLKLTGGDPNLVRGFGENTTIDASLLIQGPQVTVSQFTVTGKMLRLSAEGRYTPSKVDVNWKTAVSDLTALTPQISGHLAAQGHFSGAPHDLNLTATLSGEISSGQVPGGPVKGEIQLRGLMTDAPAGTVTVHATMAGSMADAVLSTSLTPSHDPRIVLERAGWKSMRVRGAFVLPRGSARPRMAHRSLGGSRAVAGRVPNRVGKRDIDDEPAQSGHSGNFES